MREEDREERRLSWRESGRSVIKLNVRHLWLFGVWPLGTCPLYDAYTAFGFALGVWNTVEGVVAACFIWGDLEEMTLVFANTFTIASGLVKLAFYTRDRGLYSALARRLEDLLSVQREVCSEDPELASILRGSRKQAGRLTVGMLLMMFSQGFVWFPIPAIAHPGERRLPFAQHDWDNNTHYYGLSYAVQCVAGVYLSQISFSMDCLFAAIMILVAAQLKIVSCRIGKLKADEIYEQEGERDDRLGETVLRACQKPYSNLCQCIETHQKILRFVVRLQNTMSPIAMTQFFFSVIVACMALFQATYSKDFTAVFRCVAFMPIPCGQVLLYCWAAHNVTEQAEAVSSAAYSCSWVEASPRFKRVLRIVMCRAQKPLVLTAGHLYAINRAAFLTLVNASYSYYTLLGHMNRRPTQA
ncbi:odorant receptor 43a-like [Schistocerca piceifrons]|uniref:odorant receptor 43a-like n=1 Tax=Schistocerca piceifrons TaxID=274613 RepID=UPI001F5FBAAA|nr:odorant receptor 43a-like [Schistocerca piceifrons]